MDKISKFLNSLAKKHRELILELIRRIEILDLEGMDIKLLKGHENLWRAKKGDVRIVFGKEKIEEKMKGNVLMVDFRKDIYKNL